MNDIFRQVLTLDILLISVVIVFVVFNYLKVKIRRWRKGRNEVKDRKIK